MIKKKFSELNIGDEFYHPLASKNTVLFKNTLTTYHTKKKGDSNNIYQGNLKPDTCVYVLSFKDKYGKNIFIGDRVLIGCIYNDGELEIEDIVIDDIDIDTLNYIILKDKYNIYHCQSSKNIVKIESNWGI